MRAAGDRAAQKIPVNPQDRRGPTVDLRVPAWVITLGDDEEAIGRALQLDDEQARAVA